MSHPAAHSLDQQILDAIAAYPRDPARARQLLTSQLAGDPLGFRICALAAIKDMNDPACRNYLMDMMFKRNLLPACDPKLLSLEEEIAMTRELLVIDPALDARLAKRLSAGSDPLPDECAQRVLDLLVAISDGGRVLTILSKFLRDPNPRLRSMAALVIGQNGNGPAAGENLETAGETGGRATAIESMWGAGSKKARIVLREAAMDSNAQVVGNALLGLYSLGDTTAIPRILKMAVDPNPLQRATAAWIMEQTASPRFLHSLGQMVREPDPKARTCVFHAIAALKQATARTADAARLRVHILGIDARADGQRTLRAAIATDAGGSAALPPTGVVLWEDTRMVTDFTVRKVPVPDCVGLGFILQEGKSNDQIFSALAGLQRERDRWSTFRYAPGAALAAIQSALAFLAPIAGVRHMLLHAEQIAPPASPPTDWSAAMAMARATSVSIHIVGTAGTACHQARTLAEETGGIALAAETPEAVAASCEKIYIGLLHAYEIVYRTGDKTAMHPGIKLEVYADPGYGSEAFAV